MVATSNLHLDHDVFVYLCTLSFSQPSQEMMITACDVSCLYVDMWRTKLLWCIYNVWLRLCKQERPYHSDSTASRLLSEVKHCRARLVLRWGTTLESLVLFFCSFLLFAIQYYFLLQPFWCSLLFNSADLLKYSTIHFGCCCLSFVETGNKGTITCHTFHLTWHNQVLSTS